MTARPILCLHGAFLTGHIFTPLSAALAKHTDIISQIDCPTLLGHGKDHVADLTYAKQAAWLEQIYAAERPIILGHSMGAGIALQCALDWNECPAALILCGAGLGTPSGSNTTAGFLARGIKPECSPEFITQMTKGWFAQPDHHAIPALCQQLLALSQHQFDSIRGAISVGIDQSRKTVKSLSIPTLVLHGQAPINCRSQSPVKPPWRTIRSV